MKKIYMTPQTEEVKVKTQQLMQAASSFNLTSNDATVDEDSNYETLSRGNSWLDDEEEY